MSDDVETAPPSIELATIPIDLVDESPFNPRHTFEPGALAELAEDVRLRGVLQPVLVRERPSKSGRRRFELVVGARRYRASKIAKRETIPAIVRVMADQEVLETQIAENAQRADVEPLEEGDGYRRLHEQFGVSIDDIAARVSKSRRLVYGRIQLSRLREPGRQALAKGLLSPSTALLAATLVDAQHQNEFVALLVKEAKQPYRRDDGPVSYQDALRTLRERFDLRLERAPWKLDDAELVPEAGACKACPKRKSAQAELFDEPDRDRADVCMDRACWVRKREAHTAARIAEATAAGRPVLEGKAAKWALEAIERRGSSRSEYVDVEADGWSLGVYGDRGDRSIRKLLGKGLPPTSVVLDKQGQAHEVADRADVEKALRAAGKLGAKSKSGGTGATPAEKKKQRLQRFRNAVAARVRAQIVAQAEKLGAKHAGLADVFRLLANAFVTEVWRESRKGVCTRRGLEPPKKVNYGGRDYDDALREMIKGGSPAHTLGLAVELAMARPIPVAGGDRYVADEDRGFKYGARIHQAAAVFEVDIDEIESEIATYLGAIEKAKGKAPAKRAPKRTAAKRVAKKANRTKAA